MRWRRIVKAVATPMPALLYAVAWFALQPLLLRAVHNLSTAELGSGYIAQVISTAIYIIANILWIASWYKLTKYLRSRIAVGRVPSNNTRSSA